MGEERIQQAQEAARENAATLHHLVKALQEEVAGDKCRADVELDRLREQLGQVDMGGDHLLQAQETVRGDVATLRQLVEALREEVAADKGRTAVELDKLREQLGQSDMGGNRSLQTQEATSRDAAMLRQPVEALQEEVMVQRRLLGALEDKTKASASGPFDEQLAMMRRQLGEVEEKLHQWDVLDELREELSSIVSSQLEA